MLRSKTDAFDHLAARILILYEGFVLSGFS
jgi:hypothetical protein